MLPSAQFIPEVLLRKDEPAVIPLHPIPNMENPTGVGAGLGRIRYPVVQPPANAGLKQFSVSWAGKNRKEKLGKWNPGVVDVGKTLKDPIQTFPTLPRPPLLRVPGCHIQLSNLPWATPSKAFGGEIFPNIQFFLKPPVMGGVPSRTVRKQLPGGGSVGEGKVSGSQLEKEKSRISQGETLFFPGDLLQGKEEIRMGGCKK